MQRISLVGGSCVLAVVIVIATVLFSTGFTQAQGSTPQPIKMCSAYVSGEFRDSIAVPNEWTRGTCASWAATMGASDYQLGCIVGNSFSWGTPNGGIPSPSCSWR